MSLTRGLCFTGFSAILFMSFQFYTIDACSFLLPNVCENVTCANAAMHCSQYMSYWCSNRTGGICYPIAVCDLASADPCMFTKCTATTDCIRVKDRCDYGICTLKSQCAARNRPGSCPSLSTAQMHFTSCSNFCEDDAMCEEGTKCCPVQSPVASDTQKICVQSV